MTSEVHLSFHDTPDDMFTALRRVFSEQENEGTRWVSLNVEGVRVTFFASRSASDRELQDIEEVLA